VFNNSAKISLFGVVYCVVMIDTVSGRLKNCGYRPYTLLLIPYNTGY
jgi:hypothetical protein